MRPANRHHEDARILGDRAVKLFTERRASGTWRQPPSTNPGSFDARRAGCTCPAPENGYGKGTGDPPRHVIEPTCAMHGGRS